MIRKRGERRSEARDKAGAGYRREAPATARAVAWEILRRVDEGGAYADAVLGHELSARALSRRDQGLVTRLVYGTVAWQGYLDHIAAAFSRRPLEDLDAPIRTLLRLALLQVCVLTKVPPFAAVNTAVELAKHFQGGSAAGLVNAVLRRATTGWQQVPLPSRQDDPIGHLAIRLSHPRWLVERWGAYYGLDETEALLRANNEPAPTVLRINRRVIDATTLLARLRDAGYVAESTRYAPPGMQLDSGRAVESLPGYADGACSLQSEASQLVSLLLNPRPGDRVLDACAAPGGKTTHMAELMDDRGQIVALDTNRRGVERLGRMARRLHLSIVRAAVADAAAGVPLSPTNLFDCVLVDAPCSGLGTLRQHPEIKWRRTPESIASLSRLQLQLLLSVTPLLCPGGALVYATCTLTAEENERTVAALLRARPELRVDDPRPLLPQTVHTLVGEDGMLRTFPHRHGLDGFFAVRLKRRSAGALVTP